MMIHYTCRPLSLGEKGLHHNLSAAFLLLRHLLGGGPTLQPRGAASGQMLLQEVLLFPPDANLPQLGVTCEEPR